MSICEYSQDQICKIKSLIEELDKTSTFLLSKDDVKKFKEKLEKDLKELTNQINKVKSVAESRKKVRTEDYLVYRETDKNRRIKDEINRLKKIVDRVETSSIPEYKALLKDLTIEEIEKNAIEKIETKKDFFEELKKIENPVLQRYVYIQYLKNNKEEDFEKLLTEAKYKFEQEVSNNIFEEIKKNTKETIYPSNLNNIKELRNKITYNFIEEKVTEKVIQNIKDALKKIGFIKIFTEKNNDIVIINSEKIDGKKAKFEIYPNGKFIYDFKNGYKGESCTKDIEPLISDLKNIYDIEIESESVEEDNPKRINSAIYTKAKTNFNKS